MKLVESELRLIIRKELQKFLIFEEIIDGTTAVVYHGSHTEPDKFVDLLEKDEFKPGKVFYGKGLYTFFDLDDLVEQNNPLKGSYGPYVYKLKINTKGYIALTGDIAEKIYGKPLFPSEQASALGLSEKIINKIAKWEDRHKLKNKNWKRLTFDTKYDGSVAEDFDILSQIGNFLSGLVRGIIYRNTDEGLVCVIFDPTTAIPIEWIRPVGEEYLGGSAFSRQVKYKPLDVPATWQPIQQAKVPSLTKNFESEKFEKLKYEDPERKDIAVWNLWELPADKRIIKHDLNFFGSPDVPEFPENTKIMGSLDLGATNIQSLPSGLWIKKNLSLYNCKIKQLPDNLYVGGSLQLNGIFCGVERLPSGLEIGRDLILEIPSKIKSLPDDLKVGRYIYNFRGDLEQVPAHLRDKLRISKRR